MTKRELNILDNLRRRALSQAANENRPAWRKDREREAKALERAIMELTGTTP